MNKTSRLEKLANILGEDLIDNQITIDTEKSGVMTITFYDGDEDKGAYYLITNEAGDEFDSEQIPDILFNIYFGNIDKAKTLAKEIEFIKGNTELWKKKKYLWDFKIIKEYEVKEHFNECSDCKKECKTLWGDIDYFGEINWCGKCLDCAYKYVKKLEDEGELF